MDTEPSLFGFPIFHSKLETAAAPSAVQETSNQLCKLNGTNFQIIIYFPFSAGTRSRTGLDGQPFEGQRSQLQLHCTFPIYLLLTGNHK